jgi:sterol carrier protein 2
MSSRVFVVGVGMTHFEKPHSRDWDYPDMAREAATQALEDARVDYDLIEQVFAGYVYGPSTCGQRAVYEMGLSGVPVFNVNNNCSTGSSALMLAVQLIRGGQMDCALALGFEKMQKGALDTGAEGTNPLGRHFETMARQRGTHRAPPAPQIFGNAGIEHMERYGSTKEHFAKVAHKNHLHSTKNPRSHFQDEYSLEEILESRPIHGPLTVLQCCPTSDGGAAAVVMSERLVDELGLFDQAVEVVSIAMATDRQSSFEDSAIKLVGFDMSRDASRRALSDADLSIDDVDVIELHDCFSANELITYEALGLCDEGKAGDLIDAGDVTYGGKWVVNPSGGLISKGHPLGATGLAQCAELTWQLRGQAGDRQVENAEIALQHNLGLGGAAVVAVYQKS